MSDAVSKMAVVLRQAWSESQQTVLKTQQMLAAIKHVVDNNYCN